MNSADCDLYDEIFTNIYVEHVSVSVRCMPSHLKEGKKKRQNGISELGIEANDKADELAGVAATNCQVPKPIATNHLYYVVLVKRIGDWTTTILLHLPRSEHIQGRQEPKQQVDEK